MAHQEANQCLTHIIGQYKNIFICEEHNADKGAWGDLSLMQFYFTNVLMQF